MNLDFTPESWDEYLDWLAQDRKTAKRIHLLLKDIMRNPFSGIGKPELLKGELSGFWSRWIDDRHRIVYKIHEGRCQIIQYKGHYGDT